MSEEQVKDAIAPTPNQEDLKADVPVQESKLEEETVEGQKRKAEGSVPTPKKPKRVLTKEEEDAEMKFALEEPLEEDELEDLDDDVYGAAAKSDEEEEDIGHHSMSRSRSVLTRSNRRGEPTGEDEEEQFPFGLVWKSYGTVHYLVSSEAKPSPKIAGFDLDDTLIVPKRSKKPSGRSDWKWVFPSIPEKLKKLHKEGYDVVIFSEQIDTASDKQKLADIKGKIVDLCKALGFPMFAVIATESDQYRKPYSSLFDFFIEQVNSNIKPDTTTSFYVGKEAGRPDRWKDAKTKRDLSAADRTFAHNCGLIFKTPEEYFLDEKPAPFEWDTVFDPAKFLQTIPADTPLHVGSTPLTSETQEIVLLVGPPVSGKTLFVEKHMVPNKYERVTGKTAKEVVKKLKDAVEKGTSVVIDDRNPSPKARAEYVAAAKEKNIPIRCFLMNVPMELARHLSCYQERLNPNAGITESDFTKYEKQYKEPTVEEGFSEIKKINFIPNFENNQKRIFLQRYV